MVSTFTSPAGIVHAAVTFPNDVETMLVCGWDVESVWVPLQYQPLPPPGPIAWNPVTSQNATLLETPDTNSPSIPAAADEPLFVAEASCTKGAIPSCVDPGPSSTVTSLSLTANGLLTCV